MEALDVAIKQLEGMFLLEEAERVKISQGGGYGIQAEKKALESLSAFPNKYFRARIDPFHSVFYCNYLYWLGRAAYLDGEVAIADKAYCLNKMLNAVDLFYAVSLPEHWTCEHPVGSVMGRAEYGDGFTFMQACTVGGNWHKGELQYPSIGSNVRMYSGAKVLGDSHIGNGVEISANTFIINQDVPGNCIVFGQSPNLIIKEKTGGN